MSPKRRVESKERAALTARLLALHPRCCRCGARAVELHEPQKRSRNPKAWLDPALCVPTCRACNTWAEENVLQAEDDGWLIQSWFTRDAAVRICAAWFARFT